MIRSLLRSFSLFRGVTLVIEENPDGTLDRTLESVLWPFRVVLGHWRQPPLSTSISAQALISPKGVEAHVSALGFVAQVRVDPEGDDSELADAARWDVTLQWGFKPDISLSWSAGIRDGDNRRTWRRGHVILQDLLFGKATVDVTLLGTAEILMPLPEGDRWCSVTWERIRHMRPWQPTELEPDWVTVTVATTDRKLLWAGNHPITSMSWTLDVDPTTFLPVANDVRVDFVEKILADRRTHTGQDLPPTETRSIPDDSPAPPLVVDDAN